MIVQNIKAGFLFISATLTVFGISEYNYDVPSYLGFIGLAFLFLLASNVVDLIDRWITEKRKQDLGIDERELSRLMRREAD